MDLIGVFLYKMEQEIWKDIPNFEGLYLISTNGYVKSLITNKILKTGLWVSGYKVVNLYKNKKSHHRSIHQLMAETFLDHKPNKYKIIVDHKDNDKMNNRLDNLCLTTNRNNSMKDKTQLSGESCIYPLCGKWLVRMRVNGVKHSLGVYSKIEDAVKDRNDFIGIIDNNESNKLTTSEIKELIEVYKAKIKKIELSRIE